MVVLNLRCVSQSPITHQYIFLLTILEAPLPVSSAECATKYLGSNPDSCPALKNASPIPRMAEPLGALELIQLSRSLALSLASVYFNSDLVRAFGFFHLCRSGRILS